MGNALWDRISSRRLTQLRLVSSVYRPIEGAGGALIALQPMIISADLGVRDKARLAVGF